MSVTYVVFHVEMSPYLSRAALGLAFHSLTAIRIVWLFIAGRFECGGGECGRCGLESGRTGTDVDKIDLTSRSVYFLFVPGFSANVQRLDTVFSLHSV